MGPSTDVWSFGLLAFWLLTGRYYWVGANVPAAEYNVYSLLGEVAGKEPIAPASQRLRALGETRALLPAGDFMMGSTTPRRDSDLLPRLG